MKPCNSRPTLCVVKEEQVTKLVSFVALGLIIGGFIGVAALYFSVDMEGIEVSWFSS